MYCQRHCNDSNFPIYCAASSSSSSSCRLVWNKPLSLAESDGTCFSLLKFHQSIHCIRVSCIIGMVKFSISNARYTYEHDQKYPSEYADIHHIVLRSSAKYVFVYALALLVLAYAFYLYVLKEQSISLVYYSLLFDVFLVKLLLPKPVKKGDDLNKETVIIMPAFGVQLETQYVSGKVIRCFVPIDKILKPVLVECVTPVTCYWTLSLIVRGESEVVLVFKNLRPPVKMLVHVWKALRVATDCKDETCTPAP